MFVVRSRDGTQTQSAQSLVLLLPYLRRLFFFKLALCAVVDLHFGERALVEAAPVGARRYIAAGGTIVGYEKRLTERQDAEIAVYNRVKADIEKARATMTESAFMTYWEKRNDELRNLGIKTIGLSDE